MSKAEENVRRAQDALVAAQQALARAEAKASFERSLGEPVVLHQVIRHTIDTGRIEFIGPVFANEALAARYADEQGGYGLGKDWFIRKVDFYPLDTEED